MGPQETAEAVEGDRPEKVSDPLLSYQMKLVDHPLPQNQEKGPLR